MNTFYKMWGTKTPNEAMQKIAHQQELNYKYAPANLEEQAINLVGRDIYEKLIRGYTEKQWGCKCTELPAFIIRRLPVRFTYNNNYFNALYQGIPMNGYTDMFSNMLSGIDIQLNTDYLSDQNYYNSLANKIIYSGPIDAFFNYQLGPLAYRSIEFENEILNTNNYQGNAVINFTDIETPYTRIIEHKHFALGTQKKTVISREFSIKWQLGKEPYYPMSREEDIALYEKYKVLAHSERFVVFGGRLGEYKYYDMDKIVKKAFEDYARVT